MSVCHCLFWQEKDMISAVLNKGNFFEIIRIGGNTMIPYKQDYWDIWQEYAGFLKGDFIDFCFVFDNKCPQISEYLKTRECPDYECVWNKYTIQKVADMMEITKATQIYNKDGNKIASVGSFRDVQESEIHYLMASYRNSEEVIQHEKLKNIEIAPFIEEMLKKLEAYDKQ